MLWYFGIGSVVRSVTTPAARSREGRLHAHERADQQPR
jgi:hypothetical protein